MTRILHGLLLAVSLGLPGLSIQASDDWYHIELMVFAHERASDEQWRRNRQPDYSAPYIHFSEQGTRLPDDASDTQRHALSQGAWQPVGNLSMDDMRERMTVNGNYRTLFHQSWRQPIQAREQTLPIYIQGGQALPSKATKPEPEQNSHADNSLVAAGGPAAHDLQPDQPVTGSAYAEIFNTEPVGTEHAHTTYTDLPELQGTLTLFESRFLHVEPSLWLALTDHEGQRYFASLTQNRRLQTGELHYIDNPRLGILIKVTK